MSVKLGALGLMVALWLAFTTLVVTQDAVYRLGGGAANPIELMSDGKTYFRITPSGVITLPNSANFAAVGTSADITFAAGNFTAGGSQTWTLAAGDVGAHATMRVGNIVTLTWQLNTTTVAGTPHAQLRVGTGGLTWARICEGTHYYIDNGTRGSGRVTASSGTTYVVLNISTAGSWTAATDATYDYGQITCEVS